MSKKITYVGFAFDHHLGTHGGYHHIAEYGNYDAVIDCQDYIRKGSKVRKGLFVKACHKIWFHLMMLIFKTPAFPYYLFRMLWLSLKGKCVFHIIYGENLYTPLMRLLPNSVIVCTFHQPFSWFDNKKWLNYLKQIDNVILVGETEVEKFKQATGKENVVYIPHGVFTDFYKPQGSGGQVP